MHTPGSRDLLQKYALSPLQQLQPSVRVFFPSLNPATIDEVFRAVGGEGFKLVIIKKIRVG